MNIFVYYDSKCSLCRREINYYKKIATNKELHWCDLFQHQSFLATQDIRVQSALQQLHVLDANNKKYIGVDAFIQIWQRLPYFNYLAKLASLPPFYSLAKFTYKHFAKYRFKRLKHCNLD